MSIGRIKCGKLDWTGDRAEEWRKIGLGDSVDLVRLTESEVIICCAG